MKCLVALAVIVVSTIAEPPVDNRYLPPQRGGFNGGANFNPPSQTYGPPSSGSGFGPQRQTDAIIRGNRPSQTYGTPFGRNGNSNGNQPSSQYGAPQSQPSAQYLPPSSSFNSPSGPSSSGSSFSSKPSSQYGAPGFGSNRQGSSSRTPSRQYGAPDANGPSQQYGTPEFGGGSNGFDATQNRAYLPPGRGGYAGAGDDGSNGEPANYNFEYMVKDDASGNDFGHRESRQGDRAEGLYYVVLPDGRKQTVEYEADQNGYKPRISYEDVGNGAGGYGGRSGSKNGGYQNGGQQNGGYQNGGYQNGGHQNGGYQNGGHQNGGYQNGGHQNGGHQNGGYQNGGHQNVGYQNGGPY